jgi:peptidoglycan/xylan/chitin deacetylase (PgdA/CDA1 family)
MLSEPERYAYLPLIDRPKITWPNGAHVAFWVAPNIEFYELEPPKGPVPVWPRPAPDILHYAQRDYGNRSGVWRMMEVMERYGVRGSVSLNAALCDHIPDIIDECVRLEWELFSHGIYNTRVIYGMDEEQVREVIRDSVETISARTGQPVRGWLAPALSATETMFDLLPEFGIQYTLDMVHDDQPMPIRLRRGRLISIPYSSEINDVRILNYRGYPPEAYAAMMKAAFDQLYAEGAENGMVLCMPLHPFVIGHPHRIGALADVLRHVTSHEHVWLATGREISDWYYAHHYEAALAFVAGAETAGRR